jgi:CDK-activating kinase assembly factor MAT1
VSKHEEALRQRRDLARQAAIQEAQEEKLEKERLERDLIRELASSEGSAEKIVARNKAAALKRSSARRRTEGEEVTRGWGLASLLIKEEEEEEEAAFDPLDGEGEESSLYIVRTHYDDPYRPAEMPTNVDGWTKYVMTRFIERGGSPCATCTNAVSTKRTPD